MTEDRPLEGKRYSLLGISKGKTWAESEVEPTDDFVANQKAQQQAINEANSRAEDLYHELRGLLENRCTDTELDEADQLLSDACRAAAFATLGGKPPR